MHYPRTFINADRCHLSGCKVASDILQLRAKCETPHHDQAPSSIYVPLRIEIECHYRANEVTKSSSCVLINIKSLLRLAKVHVFHVFVKMGRFGRLKNHIFGERLRPPVAEASAKRPLTDVQSSSRRTSLTIVKSSRSSTSCLAEEPCGEKKASSNPLTRDFWEKARLNLSESEKESVDEYVTAVSSSNAEATPDILHQVAQIKQEVFEDKGWCFRFQGHTLKLRNVASSIVFWLDKFKTVADVAANAQPVLAGLPWAGVKFLLLAWNLFGLSMLPGLAHSH
ncbi:hypothetical protein AJ79_01991 [Helicocarpus griseus UAMH5409]|uniref:Uncharacterized protein n=1 Tax=Helicocarpus griseus UAMH5409 TaxID=1447875 RepID=A0A2B7Y4P9_9EURO|nr:hypothetical protein AJ79_01991 [Helicocarpus griseus UAMH5409]